MVDGGRRVDSSVRWVDWSGGAGGVARRRTYGGRVAERDLHLHEVIDIVGQGQYDYMAHAAREPTNAMPEMLTLQGTFFVCAVGGGRWPQVVNV